MSTDTQNEGIHGDPVPELKRLVELAAKYPEIGPPLAELAFKIGHPEIGERVVRMGLEGRSPGVEYYFVAANAARREQRFEDALMATVDAVRAFAAAPDDAIAPDDGTRLLHLIRLGFASLLFDRKDPHAFPAFGKALAEELPRLEGRLGADPFYRALLAQTFWYEDRERSEREWERAVELGEPELTWNARGTWYKEADRDAAKAEQAYRRGLERAPQSALLRHNLAQLLVERAAGPETDPEAARKLLREADELLRAALREESPKGLRRHIHATRDRLNDVRSSLPPRPRGGARADGGAGAAAGAGAVAGAGAAVGAGAAIGAGAAVGASAAVGAGATAEAELPEREVPEPVPEVGEVVRGRVQSVTSYGAFVSIGRGLVGLLHKSELAHHPVGDVTQLVRVGDELDVKVVEVQRKEGERKLRIGLSRRALLPAVKGERERDRDRRGPHRRDERAERLDPKVEKMVEGKIANLGELLLAKLREQGEKG